MTAQSQERIYEWQEGDTLSLVALKYCQPSKAYKELEDLNKVVLCNNRYKLLPGDLIEIPESWFPIQAPSFHMQYAGSSIMGHKVMEV